MKILLIILLASCVPIHMATVQTTNSITAHQDTISITARHGLCMTRYEGDTLWKLTDLKGKYIYKDSISDFKVLIHSKK